MKTAAVTAWVLAVLATTACGIAGVSQASPSPSPLPSADVTVDYADTGGAFYLGVDQTMLIKFPHVGVHYPRILSVASRYPDATLLKAVAVGRTTVIADVTTQCTNECNTLKPLEITVVVVSDAEIQQGVTITLQDWPFVIHMRIGQHFILSVANPPSGPAWEQIVPANPPVIVPDEPASTSAVGISGRFHGAQPGRTLLTAVGPGCPAGSACPGAAATSFSFVVFR